MKVPVRYAKTALAALDRQLADLGEILRTGDPELLVATAGDALNIVSKELDVLLGFLAGSAIEAPKVTKGDVWNLYFGGDPLVIKLHEDRLVTLDAMRDPRIFVIDNSPTAVLAERWRELR